MLCNCWILLVCGMSFQEWNWEKQHEAIWNRVYSSNLPMGPKAEKTFPNFWEIFWRSTTTWGKIWTWETSLAWPVRNERQPQICKGSPIIFFDVLWVFTSLFFRMVQVCVQIGLMSPLHFNCRFFIPEAFGDGLIPPAAESDILRLYLLKKYGGVWVDATNLCRRPLDAWLPSAACEGFFAFFPDLQSPEHKGVPHIISSAWAGWIISVYIYTR